MSAKRRKRLHFQIRNIQNVIRLTKENLEALNAEFGTHQHPPSIYLQVSSKMHCYLTTSYQQHKFDNFKCVSTHDCGTQPL